MPLPCAADITVLCYRGSRKRENRTLGSIFIVAGTTIGAGMCWQCRWQRLALFQRHAGMLIGLWALMCYKCHTGGISTRSGGIPGWARWQTLSWTPRTVPGRMMPPRMRSPPPTFPEPENYRHPALAWRHALARRRSTVVHLLLFVGGV